MFEKHLWKSEILKILKNLYLKCDSSAGVFKHFASKNQLPGLSINGTLVENGLSKPLEAKFGKDHKFNSK